MMTRRLCLLSAMLLLDVVLQVTTRTTLVVAVAAAADWEATLSSNNNNNNNDIAKIAFGSCHKRKYANRNGINIWDRIAKEEASAFLWTGDAIYPPSKGVAPLQQLRQEYQQMRTNVSIGYTQMLKNDDKDGNKRPPLGIYGTWDDHDFGANDVGKEMVERAERRTLFTDFLDYPKDLQTKLASRSGLYHSVDLVYTTNNGDNVDSSSTSNRVIKVIVLDTRWNRDYHCIPSVATTKIPLGNAIACLTRWLLAGIGQPFCSKNTARSSTILGEEQWTWLQNELQTSTAPINLILSSIQFLSTNPAMEGWGHFPQEQERLLQLVNNFQRSTKAAIMILSGDVHHAEILDPTAALAASSSKHSFLEVTSSGLTHSCTQPLYGKLLCEPLVQTFSSHRRTFHDYYLDLNYGLLEVDWKKERLQAHIKSATNGSLSTSVLKTGWRSYTTMDSLTASELKQIPRTVDGHLLPYLQYIIGILIVTVAMGIQVIMWIAHPPPLPTTNDETKDPQRRGKLNSIPKDD